MERPRSRMRIQGFLEKYQSKHHRYRVLAIGVAIVVVSVPVFSAVPMVQAATVLSATVDEMVTTGTNKFSYTGSSWTNCGGCNLNAYNNSFKYAYTTGDRTVFTFSGTQAKIYGYKEPVGGIASVSVDGGIAVDVDYYAATQSMQTIFTTSVLTSGTHTVSLTVSGRKNTASKSPTINVDKAEVFSGGGTTPLADTTKPTVSLTAPASGSTAAVGAAVTLSANASDNVGVSRVEFYVNGVLKNSDTASPYSYSWNTTGTAAGTHSVTAKAYDAAGNSATSAPATITLQASTPPPGNGIASLTFDDGTIGQYTYGRPILLNHGMNATFYIVSDALGWGSSNLNATQVKQLLADGNDIGNHTRDHSNLTTLSSAQIDAQFANAQSAIKSLVGVTPTSCAYPYGGTNSTVQTIAAKYFKGCRGTNAGTNKGSALNAYNLVTFYMRQTTTAAQVRAAADSAKANDQWIIFTYHGVNPNGSWPEDVTPANMSAQLDALAASGISVVTVDDALTSYGR